VREASAIEGKKERTGTLMSGGIARNFAERSVITESTSRVAMENELQKELWKHQGESNYLWFEFWLILKTKAPSQ